MINIYSRCKLWQASPTTKIEILWMQITNTNMFFHLQSSNKLLGLGAWVAPNQGVKGQRSKVRPESESRPIFFRKNTRVQRLQRHSSWVRNVDSHHSTVFLKWGLHRIAWIILKRVAYLSMQQKSSQCYFDICPNLIRWV